MTKTKIILTLAALGVFAAGPAFAGSYSGTCTTAPKAQWMTEAAAQAKITGDGYTVTSIKTTRTGGCLRGLRNRQERQENGAVS